LTSDRDLADYFESCVRVFQQPKLVSNWVMGSLLGLLNARNKTIAESPVSPENLARLLALIEEGVISGKIAKTVFDHMARTGKPAQQIVEEKGLVQITDTDAIDGVVARIISDNPKEVEAYKNGKTKLLGFFVGRVMKETKGKANPKLVNEILRKKLE
jgi:aspartyl-tRNA(Asn)/glutamyl-tRNA(Gln) amidotransferase subunit B